MSVISINSSCDIKGNDSDEIEDGEITDDSESGENKTDQVTNENSENNSKVENNTTTEEIVEEASTSRRRESSRESSPDYSGLDLLFKIDTDPNDDPEKVVLSFKRGFKKALTNEVQEEKSKCARPGLKSACFNCGSTKHSLRQCNKPRDNRKINSARKSFSSYQERYHINDSSNNSSSKPGNVTDGVRKALGIRNGEVPAHVYQMRLLGYPPAWLDEAQIGSSGICLITSKDTSGDSKDGVIIYDDSKVVEFLGFNTSPSEGYYDDFQFHNVIPLNSIQKKNEFTKQLNTNAIHESELLTMMDITTQNDCEEENGILEETIDMDIEDNESESNTSAEFSRPLLPADCDEENNSTLPPPPPTSQSPTSINLISSDSSLSSQINERSQSPSLTELEIKHETLLVELQNSISNIDETEDTSINEELCTESTISDKSNIVHKSSINEEVCIESTISDKCNIVHKSSINEELCTESTISDKCNIVPKNANTVESSNSPSTPTVGSKRKILETYIGTPLLKLTKYEKIPQLDNFKKDVGSDLLFFENLPGASGGYKKIRSLLNTRRNTDANYDQD